MRGLELRSRVRFSVGWGLASVGAVHPYVNVRKLSVRMRVGWLCVVWDSCSAVNKNTYEIKYFDINHDEEEEDEE